MAKLAMCIWEGSILILPLLLSLTQAVSEPVRNHTFECAWREAALEYATHIQPFIARDTRKMAMLHDALQLASLCNKSFSSPMDFAILEEERRAPIMETSCDVIVDASSSLPPRQHGLHRRSTVSSLHEALQVTRQCKGNGQIILKDGTHHVLDTLVLGPQDNGLRITGEGSEAIVSGGIALKNIEWKEYKKITNDNQESKGTIYVAKIQQKLPFGIKALHVGSKRATRARYPNANPEIDIFPMGYVMNDTAWGTPEHHGKVCDPNTFCGNSTTKNIAVTDSWHGMYQNYTMGFGGACERYDPPQSPWCSKDFYTLRQVPEMHTRSPSSLFGSKLLPNYPYKNIKGAEIRTWRIGHWFSWMFEIDHTVKGRKVDHWTIAEKSNNIAGAVDNPGDSTDSIKFLGNMNTSDECWAKCNETTPCMGWTWHGATLGDWAFGCYGRVYDEWNPSPQDDMVSGRAPHVNPDEFRFGAGGHQGGEGADTAQEWYIENVLEELDAPNEFFFDEATSQLYFYPNDTESPPPTEVVVPQLANIFEIRGTMDHPVRNISIDNLVFTANRPTYMESHGVPSGGDWALQRLGAVLLEGTEDISISNNTFVRLETHAVFLSGYNRRTSIMKNEFAWLGMSGVALWGRVKNGNDGTGGEQPRFTTFESNFCYQIGMYQKQSSCFFQAVSAQTRLAKNIAFDLPRAAINFNDGFGGGCEMVDNLLFNTCRESSDHGAFNSWDRLPYITSIRNGKPSTVPAENDMHHNFIVANYAADGGCFDHDDGSAYYDMHHNFCVYGGHKSDFDGHSKISRNSLHVFPFVYLPVCFSVSTQGPPPKGYAETYVNNTCILHANEAYINIDGTDLTDFTQVDDGFVVGHNTIYVPGGADGAMVKGANDQVVTAKKFKSLGHDETSKFIDGNPTADMILSWAKDMLLGEEEHH